MDKVDAGIFSLQYSYSCYHHVFISCSVCTKHLKAITDKFVSETSYTSCHHLHSSNTQSHQMSPGTTPLPVLKELVLSLKMGYRILTNTGMGPYIQQQGLCTAFTVASLGDLGGFSPCIGRALGEIRARKPLIHGTGKCVRALRWQYPYFGLRLRVIDMGLATKYLIMVI